MRRRLKFALAIEIDEVTKKWWKEQKSIWQALSGEKCFDVSVVKGRFLKSSTWRYNWSWCVLSNSRNENYE